MAFPDILGNRPARNDHARVGVCLGVVPLSDLDILFPVVAAKEHENCDFSGLLSSTHAQIRMRQPRKIFLIAPM